MAVKLYVGGLSYSTTSEALREHFAQCGTVESATVITDRYSGQSRGFGFVEMATNEEAQKAVSMHNGQRLDGRTIKVEIANPAGSRRRRRRPRRAGHGWGTRRFGPAPTLVDSAVSPPTAPARAPGRQPAARPRASHLAGRRPRDASRRVRRFLASVTPARFVAIHGHFYQPPRESPWLERIEVQDSAAPYHDWNARVTAECYAPNTAARRVDAQNRILDVVDNFAALAFDVGPTLMAWLERERPDVYAAILSADRASRAARGHGNAIAQAYGHAILPLCSRRDKVDPGAVGPRRLPAPIRARGGRDVAPRDRRGPRDARSARRRGRAVHPPGARPGRERARARG